MEDMILDTEEVLDEIQEAPKSSQELKNELWKAITDVNVECDKAIQNMSYEDTTIKMDAEFKSNLMGILIKDLIGTIEYPIMMNLNGTDIKSFNNKDELKAFSVAVDTHTSMQYARCWVKKKQINEEYAKLISEAEEREAEMYEE